MDTRKLITVLALTLLSAACFANHTEQRELYSAPTLTRLSQTDPSGDELKTYKNGNGATVVSWNAGKEQAMEFLLQGSTDGKNFRAIKRIEAAPLSSKHIRYESTDESDKGYTWFRIIRINAAGHFSYSKPVNAQ